MTENKPEKETLKQILYAQLNKSAEELIKRTISADFLKWLIISWLSLSLVASVMRRLTGTCDNTIELDSYFKAKLICLKENK